MPKMITGLSAGKKVDIETALKLREQAKKNKSLMPKYSCIECGQPVRPHQAGNNNPAHFEHLKRNKRCSMSHRLKIWLAD